MPQRRTAIKDLRKNKKRNLHNLDIRTDLKKTVKSFERLLREKKVDEAKSTLHSLFKKFDKAAKRHILHRNTASRRKSRFATLLKSIA